MRRARARQAFVAAVLAAASGPACAFEGLDGLTGHGDGGPSMMNQGDAAGADAAVDGPAGPREAGADAAADARGDGPPADGTSPPMDGASQDAPADGGDAMPPPPVVAHVQNVAQVATGGSLTVTFSKAVGAGDLLVGAFHTVGTPTVSDSRNGSWIQVANLSNVYVFYLQNTVAAAAGHLAVTLTSSTQGSLRISADEFSGVAATSALDARSTGSSTGTKWSAGTTPAIPAGELVYAWAGTSESVVFMAGTTNGVPMTIGGQSVTPSTGAILSEYALSSAAGPQDSTATVFPASTKGVNGGQVTFRP